MVIVFLLIIFVFLFFVTCGRHLQDDWVRPECVVCNYGNQILVASIKMRFRALLVQSRIDEEILNSERRVQARMIPQILAGGSRSGK